MHRLLSAAFALRVILSSVLVTLAFSSISLADAPKFGFIGDSITANYALPASPSGDGWAVESFIRVAAPDTSVVVNYGVSGTTLEDWSPISSLYQGAVTSFKAAGVDTVLIDLGVNDSKTGDYTSPGDYNREMEALCSALISQGIDKVIINAPTYVVPGSQGGTWDSASNVLIQSYAEEIASLTDGVHIFQGDTTAYQFFQENPGYLIDGVHPTVAGAQILGEKWALAYQATVVPESSTAFLALCACGIMGTVWFLRNRRTVTVLFLPDK